MKTLCVLAVLASLAGPMHAQATVAVRAGLTASSALVRDILVEPVRTRPGLAPTLFVGAGLPIGTDYRIGIEGSVSHASLTARGDSTRTEYDAGSITNLTAIAHLEGEILSALHWKGGVGFIHYAPGERQGIFARGGTTRPLFMAGLDFRSGAFGAWDLIAAARYDFHRFTTSELRRRGFAQQQGVQRGSLSVGLGRTL